MAGHSRSKNGVASLAYVTQVGFIRLAHLLLRNSGKPEFRCHPRLIVLAEEVHARLKAGHDA